MSLIFLQPCKSTIEGPLFHLITFFSSRTKLADSLQGWIFSAWRPVIGNESEALLYRAEWKVGNSANPRPSCLSVFLVRVEAIATPFEPQMAILTDAL
jgi:hypothetical protein